VEGHIARRELLVSDPHSEFSSVKDEVAHETSASVLHPNTLVLGVVVLVHSEDEVGQRSGLCDLPVNTHNVDAGGCASGVEYKVTNLSEKVVLVCPPTVAVIAVWVALDHPRALEIRARDESGQIVRISY